MNKENTVICYVCKGTGKKTYNDTPCSCCKGIGKLTEEQVRIKLQIFKDIADRLTKLHSKKSS